MEWGSTERQVLGFGSCCLFSDFSSGKPSKWPLSSHPIQQKGLPRQLVSHHKCRRHRKNETAQSCSLTLVSAADKTAERLLRFRRAMGATLLPSVVTGPNLLWHKLVQNGATLPKKKSDQRDPKITFHNIH